jgi:hypothetical protein
VSAAEALLDAVKRREAAAARALLDADPGLAVLLTRGADLDVFQAATAGRIDRVRTLRDSLHRTRLRSLAELISAQGAAVPTEWTFLMDLDAFDRGLERKGDGQERRGTAG